PSLTRNPSRFGLRCNTSLGERPVGLNVSIEVLSEPTLSVNPRIVPAGSDADVTYNTNGLTCDLRRGGTTVLSGVSTVADTTYSATSITATTRFELDCGSGIIESATVEVLGVGFET